MSDIGQMKRLQLSKGHHKNPEESVCFAEVVAFLEGEKHSDDPECMCPVIAQYARAINDNMPLHIRNELLAPLIPLAAGTRSKADEQKRAKFIVMQTVNRILPIVLKGDVHDDILKACIEADTPEKALTASYKAQCVTKDGPAFYGFLAAITTFSNTETLTFEGTAYAAQAAIAIGDHEIVYRIAADILKEAMLIGRHDGSTQVNKDTERAAALLEMHDVQNS